MPENSITPAERTGLDDKAELEKQLFDLKKQVKEENKLLDTIRSASNTLKQEQEKKEQEMTTLSGKLLLVTKDVEDMDARKAANAGTLAAQEDTLEQNVEEIAELAFKKSALKRDVEEFEADAAKREESERQRIKAVLEPEYEDLRGKIAAMLHQRSEAESARDKAKREHDELSEKSKNLREFIDAQSARKSKVLADIADLETRLAALEREESSSQDQIEDYTSQKHELKAALADLTKEAAALTDTIAILKVEASESEDLAVEKKAEYDGQIKRLFAIGDRETRLDQREAFIKAKYEQAGVEYR